MVKDQNANEHYPLAIERDNFRNSFIFIFDDNINSKSISKLKSHNGHDIAVGDVIRYFSTFCSTADNAELMVRFKQDIRTLDTPEKEERIITVLAVPVFKN